MDTLVTIKPDNTFSTTVYTKPTHTDQYLHWDSNHHITAKQSVFNTLAQRAKTVSSSQVSFNKEMDHIKTALQHCQFPLGPSTSGNSSSPNPTNRPTTIPTLPTATTQQTTPETRPPLQSHTYPIQVKNSRNCAKGKESRYTSKAPTPSGQH